MKTALAIVALTSSLTATAGTVSDFTQVDDSGSLSQLIRSNAPQYWAYMRSKANLKDIKPFLEFTGVVTGDPHLGNFSARPIKSAKGGALKMRYVDIDFDDAGEAPFVLDFVRYLVTVKSFSDDVKIKEMQEAYIKGLQGKAMTPPGVVSKLLAMGADNYQKLAADYVTKHTTDTGFKFEDGKVEKPKTRIDQKQLAALFPGEKVVDVAARPKERGGSVEGERIWVLVEGADGRRIMELKERETPGVAKYQSQPAVKTWSKEVHDALWPDLDPSSYDLVSFDGGAFWLREKGVSLIDVPYSSEKAKSLDYVHELAVYDANVLGILHGNQSSEYAKAVDKQSDAFHDAVKALVNEYLDFAKKAYKDN